MFGEEWCRNKPEHRFDMYIEIVLVPNNYVKLKSFYFEKVRQRTMELWIDAQTLEQMIGCLAGRRLHSILITP